MGQQQLLLVILVTIIVGIATVVAINTFGSAADNANLDAVRQDIAQIASSAQGYYMKPTALGGGGQTFNDATTPLTFNNVAFPADEVSSDGLTAYNSNGTYIISAPTGTQFTITAHPASTFDGAPSLTSTSSPATGSLAATVTEGDVSYTDNSVTQ